MAVFQFRGKSIVHSYHMVIPPRSLILNDKKSLNPRHEDDNMIIQGDNLYALKALLPKYRGRIDCVYMDPPYNRGHKKQSGDIEGGWIYSDDVGHPLMKTWLRETIGSDDLQKHDKWACMMWPRLQLINELLSDVGVIFVSIDDNEQTRLRMMMDEIFGEENHVSTMPVRSHPNGRHYGSIANQHEYVVAYARENSELNLLPREDEDLMTDTKGRFRLFELRNRNKKFNSENRPNLFYPFYVDPSSADKDGFYAVSLDSKRGWEKVYPQKTEGVQTVWRWGKQKVRENPSETVARKKSNGLFGIYSKNRSQGKHLLSILYDKQYRNEAGTLVLKDIFQKTVFPYPKSLHLVSQLVYLGTSANSIVLDMTAGSGTTGHAVLSINKEHGGNRRFILVEQEAYADKITAERIRRVARGVKSSRHHQEALGGSFSYYTLGQAMDVEKILSGKSLPPRADLALHLLYTIGISDAKKSGIRDSPDGKFYSTADTDYYLLYKPALKYLREKSNLTESLVEKICESGRNAVVFAADKAMSTYELASRGISFFRLPDAIYEGV